jgi:hypothetical protein
MRGQVSGFSQADPADQELERKRFWTTGRLIFVSQVKSNCWKVLSTEKRACLVRR